MPWKETCVESVRYQFILAVQNGKATFTEICEAYGISCKTGYKWVKEFKKGGRAALADKPRTPRSRPRDTSKDIEAAIISAQLRHPVWGAKKLKILLVRDRPEIAWPSVTTFSNILKRNGFTTRRNKRVRLAQAAPLQDCNGPNDVWSADFKGWFKTGDGRACEPFTLSDGYSRFVLCSGHVVRKDFESVWAYLQEAFQEYGMPLRIRTDNGPPFASTSLGRLSHLAVKLIRLGITPEWIAPGKPQENGRHERMHRTLKLEAANPPRENLSEQREAFDRWKYEYNFVRPHEALGMATPGAIYTPSFRLWTANEGDPLYPEVYETRRVQQRGVIKWGGTKVFLTELLTHQTVGMRTMNNGLTEVYFGAILLGTIDPILGFKRA